MTTKQLDALGVGRGGRMSRQRKRDAVLRLLRGEDLDTVSRSLGVTAATLSNWRDAFLDGGEANLASKPLDGEERESERLKARLGEMLAAGAEDRATGGQPWPLARRGRGDEPSALAQQRQALWPRPGLPDLAQCASERLSASPVGASAAEAGSIRPDAGCGPAGTDPWRPLQEPLSRRRSPEGLGTAADRRHPHVAATGAAAHAREQPAGTRSGWSAARPAQP